MTSPLSPRKQQTRPVQYALWGIALLIVGGLTVYYLFLTLSASVISGDSALFAEMTRVLIEPDLALYVDLWDSKPPGLFFFTAPFVLLFGNTTAAIQLAAVAEVLLFALTTTLLARQLSDTWLITLVAACMALFYGALIAVTRGIDTTLLMCALVNLSLIMILRTQPDRLWPVALGGLLFAGAVFSKQPAAFQFPMLPVALWMVYGRSRFLPALLALCAGGAAGILLFVLWGATSSSLPLLWEYLVTGNVRYSTLDILFGRGTDETIGLYFVRRETLPVLLPLLVAAGAGLSVVWRSGRRWLAAVFISGLLTAFFAGSLGPALKITYFLPMLPFAIALTACLADWLWQQRPALSGVLAVLMAGVMVISVQGYYRGFYHVIQHNQNENSPVLDMVDYITTYTAVDDCLWLWGYVNSLSYYSERESCTAVPHEAMVMDASAFAIDAYRVQYMNDLLENQPSLLYFSDSWWFFPMLERYADRYVRDNSSLAVNVSLRHVNLSAFVPMQARFAAYFSLIGSDIRRVDRVCAGDMITYAPTWRVHQAPPQRYQMFVQIRSAEAHRLILGIDGSPDPAYRMTNWQQPDEIILSPDIQFELPASLPAGDYYTALGFYDLQTLERLPVTDASGTLQHEIRLDDFSVSTCEDNPRFGSD